MDDGAIWSSLVDSIHDGLELERQFPGARPLLAHYTSLDALERPRGVEPKLKFKIKLVEGVTPPDLSLNNILASIILGPSTSSALAFRSVLRMLDLIGKPELKDRVIASSIPLRAT